MAAEVERLAERDRDGMEVAEAPVLRAVDRGAHDRHAFLDGDQGRTRTYRARLTLLARPFGEHAQRVAATHDVAHHPDRLTIGLAAPHRDRAEDADERPDEPVVVRLLLGDVV